MKFVWNFPAFFSKCEFCMKLSLVLVTFSGEGGVFYTLDVLSSGSDDDDDDDDDEVMSDPRMFFKSTRNLVYNSLGVGGPRYVRIFFMSKLLWV